MVKSVHAVAAEIRRRLPGVGNVKLHKLLYYAQGHHLAAFGDPLFAETISAWDMGPVVGTFWFEQRNGLPTAADEVLDEPELNTVGYVVSRYGGLTGPDLIRLSHGEAPWQRANEHRRPGTSVRIPSENIREYFASVADDDDEGGPPLDSELLDKILAGAQERLARPGRTDSHEALHERRAQLLG
jgi:uncharacterized phage-associated protein